MFEQDAIFRYNCFVGKALVSEVLSRRQLRNGGWSFFGSEQASIEVSDDAGSASRGLGFLLNSQRRGGAWPSFAAVSRTYPNCIPYSMGTCGSWWRLCRW
ncbi:MAG: hypothetical protein ACR2NN_16255 [Bryobacteraceae bacterium]